MAGISLVNLSVQASEQLAAAKSTGAVSTSGAQSFEQYLGGSRLSQEKTESFSGDASDKTTMAANQNTFSGKQTEALQDREAVESTTMGQPSEETTPDMLRQELRDIVKDTLSIDDDTMDAALQMMGIVVTDLLNPDTLQQFVLLVSGGEEATDFLTNEDMLGSFLSLTQGLEDFMAENAETLQLMETLETPVPLEEFMEDGLSGELTEQGFSVSGAEQADMDETVISVKVTQETASIQNAAAAGEAGQSDASGGKVSETAAADAGEAEDVIVLQDAADGTEETSQNPDGELQDEASADELFFAQGSETPDSAKQVTTPLFAEQMADVQTDAQALGAELNPEQRMQQMVDIVRQVSEQLHRSIDADTTRMEMQLNPERLGKVFFSVVSKGGVMTATFQVQSEEAKQALESQMITLKENLEAKNLKVESVDVQIADFSFEQSRESGQQEQNDLTKQEKRRFRYDSELAEDTEEPEQISAEQMRRQVMYDNGGNIDFTA